MTADAQTVNFLPKAMKTLAEGLVAIGRPSWACTVWATQQRWADKGWMDMESAPPSPTKSSITE